MPVTQASPDIKSKAAKKWRTSEKIWLPVWRDAAGGMIKTSAGFLPVKPMYEQYAIAVYHFEKFKDYSDAEFAAEIDTLNTSSWGGFSAHQAWISEIHSKGDETLGDSTGERIHYVVRCVRRTDGWKFQMPDVGYVYDDGADIKSFLSVDDCPYIGNLDASGNDGAGTMVIKLAATKNTLNFNAINGLS